MEETLWSVVSRTVQQSGSIERAVFFLLLGFSLVSWSIIFWKICALYEARRNSDRFTAVFEGADSFGSVLAGGNASGPSPLLSVFRAALGAMEKQPPAAAAKTVAPADPKQIQMNPQGTAEGTMVISMQHAAQGDFRRLQYGLGFLATVGSTSPFIGLFGTVWGIMNTFRDLGNAKSATLAVVAPGISSALIATAAGLAVAIPAVMAYNWLLGQIYNLQEHADEFVEQVTVLVRASGYFQSTSPEPHASAAPRPAAGHQVPIQHPPPAPAPAIAGAPSITGASQS